jgi:hypothetical protein
MTLYLALPSASEHMQAVVNSGWKYLLASYFYYRKKEQADWLIKLALQGNSIFLDSGAFSAYAKGSCIAMEDYCSFIKTHEIAHHANLDVIGDPAASWANFKEMSSRGLDPLPVFHLGSPEKWLLRYLELSDRIALGGMVKAPGLNKWLDGVWNLIDKYNPKVKIHGFGLTALDLLLQYPWDSIDSSAYCATVKHFRHPLWNGSSMTDIHTNKLRLQRSGNKDISPKICGQERLFWIEDAIKQYGMMMDYVNRKQEIRQPNGFTQQQSLF